MIWIFWVSLISCLYPLTGYAICLAVLARLRNRVDTIEPIEPTEPSRRVRFPFNTFNRLSGFWTTFRNTFVFLGAGILEYPAKSLIF